MMLRFRVYFGDGSTWSGPDPFSPPQRYDVQVIAVEADNARGFTLDHGKDYYVFRDGTWGNVDLGGLFDYLMLYNGPQSTLHGRTLKNEGFWDTVSRASKEGLG